MSQATAAQPEPPQPPDAGRTAGVRQGMLRRVMGELLLHVSARIGLVWVAVLALCAIFAPLIASSHPILMRTADTGGEPLTILSRFEPGALASPWLRHLNEADVLLPLILLGLVVVVAWRGVSGGRRAVTLLAYTGLLVVFALWARHLGPFVTAVHEMWLVDWRDWRDWRDGVERVTGVPPRLPVGPVLWWLLLWTGLAIMLAVTTVATTASVMLVARRTLTPRTLWLIPPAVVVAAGVWIALVSTLGLWAWVGGLALGVAAVAVAIVRGRGVDGRALAAVMLAAGVLFGGWMVHKPVTPPRLPVPEQYRQAPEAGEIDWAIMPPIPYSPDDSMRDSVVNMRLQSPGMHPDPGTVSEHILRLAERATDTRYRDAVDPALLERFNETRGEQRVAMAVTMAEQIFDDYLDTPGAQPAGLTRPRQQIALLADAELEKRRHLLGTTRLSSDLAANMVHGTRIALSVGFISTGIAIVIGVIIGGIMGYFSGIVDLLGMRFVEMFSAIPTLFLLLAFVAAFGANLYIIMIIIGLTSWVGYAVYVRAEFLRLRQQEFIQAAQALGLPLPVVLLRHLLPNGMAPVLVAASFGVASAIGFEATLSFLGIGLDTEASWGLLLEQALEGGTFHWWITIAPGLAIFLTVFSYVLIGEALRDAIDPRTQTAKD